MTLRTTVLWLLLCLIAAWVYQSGIAGPAVTYNEAPLFIPERLSGSSVISPHDGDLSSYQTLERSLSVASFALETNYFDRGIEGQREINLVIHLVIALLIVLFSHDVLVSMGYRNAPWLALVVGAVWMLSPLLLSSVLHVPQRMIQLAALFVLIANWSYLRWRVGRGQIWLWLCLAACLVAPLAQESGILALPMLVLMEFTLFGCGGMRAFWAQRMRILSMFVAVLVVVCALIALQFDTSISQTGSQHFKLVTFLSMQWQILWAYVAQLFWPRPELLGVYQDGYMVAKGPSDATMAAAGWFAWLIVLFGAWFLRRRLPLLFYGLTLFLLGHFIQAYLDPLALYAEPRNYLVSFGLLIAAASVIGGFLKVLPWLMPWLCLAVVVILGRNTGLLIKEAQLWSSERNLHIVALNRFPDSVQANIGYARVLASRGAYDEAMAYASFEQTLDARSALRHQIVNLGLHCYASRKIGPSQLAALSATASDFRDIEVSQRMSLFVQQAVNSGCAGTDLVALAERLKVLTYFSAPEYISSNTYLSLATLENHLQRYQQGLEYINILLEFSPYNIQAKMMKLFFTAALGKEEEHLELLSELRQLSSQGKLNPQDQYNLSLFER